MEVVRLAKGNARLAVWAGGGAFGPSNGIVDGIAVLGARVFVNTLITSKLFSVEVQPDGSAGKVSEMTLDRVLEKPDGMRLVGDTLMVAETAENGALSRVTANGNNGRVETLRKSFEQGVVALTVVNKVAYVLGNRALTGTRKDGDAARFEAVAVPLEPTPSR